MTDYSVVIPCFNAAPFLRETLESACQQTLPPREVLVIDDGSTDDSPQIAETFGSPVRVVRQTNQGESVARNRGIDEAAGEWIAFLDADDRWEPDKTQRQLAAVEGRSDVICVHTHRYYFGIRHEVPPPPPFAVAGAYDVEHLLIEATVNPSTAMVRRASPVRFPEWTRRSEDMIYFAELSSHGKFVFMNQPLTGYRTHSAQQHRTADHFARSTESRLSWVERNRATLGEAPARRLETAMRQQLLDLIEAARWQRDWDQYWPLRQYAATLAWQGEKPAALRRRIYPSCIYRMKDAFDALLARRSAKVM